MEQVDIPEERIERFVQQGGMKGENLKNFLDKKCYSLTALSMDPEIFFSLLFKGNILFKKALCISCKRNIGNLLDVELWVSEPYSLEVVKEIREAYKKKNLTPPFEGFDFQSMDKSKTGREVIKERLILAHKAGLDIS